MPALLFIFTPAIPSTVVECVGGSVRVFVCGVVLVVCVCDLFLFDTVLSNFVSCAVWCCSCCVFVCVTCLSSKQLFH